MSSEPADTDTSSTVTETEQFLLTRVDTIAASDLERWYGYVAIVGAHRWGIDLEKGAGEQSYSHLEVALEDAMDDLAAEGRLGVVGDEVLEKAGELVDMIEDVHEPGPLAVKEVDR